MMISNFRLAITPLVCVVAGCATISSAQPHEGQVRIGQIAYVSGPSVRPIKLIEDSRCPSGVACVWAGRLVVRVEVRGGAWKKQLDLTLGQGQHVADGELTLMSATPEPRSDRKIAPADYRFTFAFAGGY